MNIQIDSKVSIFGADTKKQKVLKDWFTFKNPDYEKAVRFGKTRFTNIPKTIELFEQAPGCIRVPRGIAPDILDSLPSEASLVSSPVSFPPLRRLTLRPEQRYGREAVCEALTKSPTGVHLGVFPTSFGKSILGCSVAHFFQERTLILLHTKVLEDGWKKDLNKYFSLTPEHLSVVRGTDTLRKYMEETKPPITIASLQTVSRLKDKELQSFLDLFGMVIADEVQIVPADSVYRTISRSRSKFLLGLTATPERNDGKEFMIHGCFGRPCEDIRTTVRSLPSANVFPVREVKILSAGRYNGKTPKKETFSLGLTPEGHNPLNNQNKSSSCVSVCVSSSSLQKRYPEKKKEGGSMRGGLTRDDWLNYSRWVRESQERTEWVTDSVVGDVYHPKTNVVLVVTHWVEHAKELFGRLKEKLPEKQIELLTGKTNKQGRFAELIQSAEDNRLDIVVATIQVLKFGANLPHFTSIHLTTSVGNRLDHEQVIGRIRRWYNGKARATVFDYVDIDEPISMKHAARRLPTYQAHGFFLQETRKSFPETIESNPLLREQLK